MKTMNINELTIYTVLSFICVLAGVFMIGVSHQIMNGVGVSLGIDFFIALGVAVLFAVMFNVLHHVIFVKK